MYAFMTFDTYIIKIIIHKIRADHLFEVTPQIGLLFSFWHRIRCLIKFSTFYSSQKMQIPFIENE